MITHSIISTAAGDSAVTASLEASHVSVRWAPGRQEATAGSWASLEASWAARGCSGVWVHWQQVGLVKGIAGIGGGSRECGDKVAMR
jgi:hypothetical protein